MGNLTFLKRLFLICALVSISKSRLEALSSIFWTPCTTSVQPLGTGNFSISNFFTVPDRKEPHPFFPTDVGVTVGLFQWGCIQNEIGIDYFGGINNPVFLNTKFGIKENILFPRFPSMSLGIYGVGLSWSGPNRTNTNIVDFCLGKKIGNGDLFVGVYHGSEIIGEDTTGFMIAFDYFFSERYYYNKRKYYRWQFTADYASGKNIQGGGGVAMVYYFTPDVMLQVGPVWFNDFEQNGHWKVCIDLDINFTLWKQKKCS